jgi:hypothetical protein
MVGLKALDLSECSKMKTLPASMGALTNLTSLSFIARNMPALPDVVCKLSSLVSLDLICCSMRTLPDALDNLSIAIPKSPSATQKIHVCVCVVFLRGKCVFRLLSRVERMVRWYSRQPSNRQTVKTSTWTVAVAVADLAVAVDADVWMSDRG